MNFHYNEWLTGELTRLQTELELTNYDVKVEDEQFFLGHNVEPNTIYVVIKYLSTSLQTGAIIQPVQMMILSEQDGLDKVKVLFDKFSEKYNWHVNLENSEYIKHQYNSPVVLSNFNEVAFGYRSVLYMSSTLYIMEDVVDIKTLEIDENEYLPISFSMSYNMSTNTSAKPDSPIAKSKKTVSTFALTITLPLVSSDLVEDVLDTINCDNDGSELYDFVITLTNDFVITKSLALISCQIITAINQIPSLQLGFME